MGLEGLPQSWVLSSLGDIASLITKGTTPTTAGFKYEQTGVRFVKVENIDRFGINTESITEFISEEAHQALSRSQFTEGDVLFSIAGTIGKTALVSSKHLPANTNQAVAIIRGVGDAFLPEFLKYQLQRSATEIQKSNARGGAMNNISLGDLKASMMLLPPLAEQKVIAEKLDALLAQVETTKARLERIPDILKRFRQSVLAAAVSGRLTEEWRGKKPEWEQTSLDECTDRIGDGLHGTPIYSEDGEYYFVNGNNLVGGSIVIKESTKRIDASEFLKHRRDIGRNTLLLSINGTIGNLALYQGEKVILGKSACYLNFNKKIQREFGYILLSSTDFIQYANEVATGATIKNVPLKGVRNYKFLIPSLAEQTEIVRRVEQLFAFADTIEQKANAALERVNNLTQSILAKAFRGELTAEWRAANPDLISGENSAEALLKRIKAERAENVGRKRR
jgi:type I restriction enzyme S subunit